MLPVLSRDCLFLVLGLEIFFSLRCVVGTGKETSQWKISGS